MKAKIKKLSEDIAQSIEIQFVKSGSPKKKVKRTISKASEKLAKRLGKILAKQEKEEQKVLKKKKKEEGKPKKNSVKSIVAKKQDTQAIENIKETGNSKPAKSVAVKPALPKPTASNPKTITAPAKPTGAVKSAADKGQSQKK